MITPKSIAIVKKTAVHVSGDDVSGIHYQSNETQDNSSTTVSSAASVALSAELAKKQQLQQLSHIDTTTTMQQHSSNTSIRSIKSVSTSSSPPKHQPIQQQSNSTTSQASSTTCISTVPSHVVMHPSPKRSATPFSTNVSANGDIVFETHIMAPHSPMVAPSSSSYSNSQQPQQIDSPTSMDRPVPEQVSMISISLAEKHLLDMIHPLPPPISPLSITCTSDAMDQPPDLHLSDQHDGQTQQYSQHSQQQIQPSLDQHDQDHNMQISTAPQQVVEEEAPSIQQKRFWTWLFPPPPIALSTNQNKESLPSASSSPISNNVTKKNNPHNQLHNNNNNNNNNISPGPPLLSEMSSSPIPVPSSSYIESSSPSVISSPASSSVQPMINNRKGGRRNQVLPPFRSQYRVPPSSSSTATINNNIKPSGKFFDKAIESINQFIQQASSINSGNNKSADRVIHTDPDSWKQQMKARFARFIDDIKSDPDGFAGKKIVVVGVHGWFPMKLVRSMIGEPTGTSTKFCEQMVAAVKKYFEQEHGVSLSEETTTITSVPLEGEGKVEDRVNKLYNNLINHSVWLEAVSSADVILWATHSQGTPVSVMLMHRLLERGHIHTHRQSVGMLAMAGISHGPFPVLKGSLIVKYFEADAARELFEFMDSESDISQKFRRSLGYIMERGIKLTLVGSMQDQVVPLYSAIISAISHPNIVRSVYIDGHIFTQENEFLIRLITFALGLRNAGLSDHGLLTHLSEVLAGSLYALEGGHSTIYEELDVYSLAVQHLFETDPLGKAILINNTQSSSRHDNRKNSITTNSSSTTEESKKEAKLYPFQAKSIKNPYYLPWAMRGICEDSLILNNPLWSDELDQLRLMFDEWEPISPKLRSVKIRLEPFTLTLV